MTFHGRDKPLSSSEAAEQLYEIYLAVNSAYVETIRAKTHISSEVHFEIFISEKEILLV